VEEEEAATHAPTMPRAAPTNAAAAAAAAAVAAADVRLVIRLRPVFWLLEGVVGDLRLISPSIVFEIRGGGCSAATAMA
jgi:hypothetical protein